MVETTGAGLRVKEEEIELDLGLSIGGSFGKKEKILFSQSRHAVDSKPDDCLNASLKENPPLPVFDAEQESGGFVDDPQRKRAMQALRRQEAKKKREEKQQKKGQGRVKNGECFHGGFLEPIERRVKDRKAREKEADNDGERARKNEKLEQTESEKHSVNPYHIMPMQYSYPPLQYVPYANGFAIPWVMPCWAAGGALDAAAGNEKNSFQPEACRSFLPFRGQSTGLKMTNGDSDGENRKIASNGSSICSSVSSDFQSSSHEGVGSSDSKSNSSPSLPAHPRLNCSTVDDDVKAQFEHTASSSSPVESSQGIVENPNSDKKIKEEAISEAPPAPLNNANSITKTTSPAPLKETKGNLGKPPKPITTSSLLQMPCVSTTGNGPNGKTINGFLFRYTKTEVSIVCVCHGSSFSPAEFVQHAGGTNVTNPLRHITVIPSAFG